MYPDLGVRLFPRRLFDQRTNTCVLLAKGLRGAQESGPFQIAATQNSAAGKHLKSADGLSQAFSRDKCPQRPMRVCLLPLG